jgi:CBS domain containing-hemolysin-like protein
MIYCHLDFSKCYGLVLVKVNGKLIVSSNFVEIQYRSLASIFPFVLINSLFPPLSFFQRLFGPIYELSDIKLTLEKE